MTEPHPETDVDDQPEPGEPTHEPAIADEPEHEPGEGGDVVEHDQPVVVEHDQPQAPAPSIEAQRKQQDKDRERLIKENDRHATRVREIMGEDAGYLVECPLCADPAPGFLYLPETGALSEEQTQLLRNLLGLATSDQYAQHPTIDTCSTCHGYAEVKTGSKRQGYDVITCPTCQGKGWFDSAQPAASQPAPAPLTGPLALAPDQPTPPAPVADDVADDPDVAALRARGFMVVPPMTARV